MGSNIPFAYQGSKMKELSKIKDLIGHNIRIAEPFFGSGIITGTLGSNNSCVANDLNIDIYMIWKCSKENNKEFFSNILSFCDENNRNPEYYYKRREDYNILWKENIVSVERASLFYFLLNSCHSAMVRYGPNGFNTSYKLFLSNGRYFNVLDKIKILKEYSSKIKSLYNMNSLELLKNNLDVDIIYCDPPYINSTSSYVGGWGEEQYEELLKLLKFQYTKNNIPSIISNYESKFDDKFDRLIKFSVSRFAGTSITESNDILGVIGNIDKFKPNTLEYFL
jgi:DNA adenine methylase Dam